jgi:hypothetical protein
MLLAVKLASVRMRVRFIHRIRFRVRDSSRVGAGLGVGIVVDSFCISYISIILVLTMYSNRTFIIQLMLL